MAIPTRQMGRPQPRPMQARPQASTMMQPAQQMSARAIPPVAQRQVGQQQLNATASPLRNPITSPRVAQPQSMQPTPTRVQQPMQRDQLNAPAVIPNEVPSRPGGGGVMKMPETGGLEPNPGGGYSPVPPATTMPRRFGGFSGGIFEEDGAGGMRVIEPGPGNELSSTGQQGMPKYDPTGMGGGEMPTPPGGGGVFKMMKRGGKVTAVKKYAKGGAVKSTPVKASSRGDGIAQRGKTKGKIY